MEQILKITKKIFAVITGKPTWNMIEYFDPSWQKRIREMAEYIPADSSILDLGCGKMWLKQYTGTSSYFPVDYTDRGDGTIVCDFNKHQFPEQKADVAFVSGTLEYIEDPEWFISSISNNCNACVISYCILENYPDLAFRLRQAWKNSYTREGIIALFSRYGFELKAENDAISKNRIFYFTKKS